MPYIIDKNNHIKKHNFDYENFYNDLLQNILFKNNHSYLSNWFEIISKAEMNNDLKELECLNTTFEYELPVANQNFYFHFNVERISKEIMKHPFKYPPFKIKTSCFSDNAIVSYTHIDYNNKHIKSKKPIIIIPMLQDNAEYLVIDGNHRVSAKLDNNIKKIRCIVYTPSHIYDFHFKIDFVMWMFINEINNFSDLIHEYNVEMNDLLKQSYIKKVESYLL